MNAFTCGRGDAGSITINVSQLSVADGAINIFTEGRGNAGSLNIDASESIQLSGDSEIDAGTRSGSTGNSGNLNITTARLTIADESQINTGTRGQGNAGNLIINANEAIELSGTTEDGRSGLFSSALVENGNGGNLQIFTQDLTIADGAIINVSNFPSIKGIVEPGTAEAGNLTVEATSLNLNDGRIDAATQAGNGGNITLNIADNITLQDNGFISARALKDANGGNINIDTHFIIAFPDGNNDIIANAQRGNGGNININVESLLGIQERASNDSTNDINASSEFSFDGNVTISTPDINPVEGTTELPQNLVEIGETVAQACETNRDATATSGFSIVGSGIPAEPGLPLDSYNISVGSETDPTSAVSQLIETSKGEIQPARGIKVTQTGTIILTAHRTNNSGEKLLENRRNCVSVSQRSTFRPTFT